VKEAGLQNKYLALICLFVWLFATSLKE